MGIDIYPLAVAVYHALELDDIGAAGVGLVGKLCYNPHIPSCIIVLAQYLHCHVYQMGWN